LYSFKNDVHLWSPVLVDNCHAKVNNSCESQPNYAATEFTNYYSRFFWLWVAHSSRVLVSASRGNKL